MERIFPCRYLLDDAGEAEQVRRYCSTTCQAADSVDQPSRCEEEAEWSIPCHWQCDHCGKALFPELEADDA